MKKLVISIIIISAGFLFSACENTIAPFDSGLVSQVKDEIPPVIEIISPQNDSEYSQRVTVNGTISDDGIDMPFVEYTITDVLGSQVKSGEITITPADVEEGVAGTFSFIFSTSEYSSDILLTLTGKDWNGNNAEAVALKLVYPGSAISSFKAVPGNKKVSLSWEAVEGAENYSLYYTIDGSFPSSQFGIRIEGLQSSYTEAAPFIIDELDNGEIYTFLIVASSGTAEWASAYKQAVPLSPLSLKPEIISMYDRLQLNWQPMSIRLGYQVYKSIGNSGNYVNITGILSDSFYVDTNIIPGNTYSYKILPDVEGSIFSESSSASPVKFPSTSYREVSSLSTIGGSSDIDVAGNYIFLAQGSEGLQRVSISDKSNPIVFSPTTWSECNVKAVDTADYYAYVADRNRGLQIYSYNKADFGLRGLCPTSHTDDKINDVVYSDNAGIYAYAAWPLDFGLGSGGVDRISVSNKDEPIVINSYTRADADYYKLAVSSDGAYIFAVYIDPWTPYLGMDIIQTSNMSRVYPVSGGGLPAQDVALSGDYAYVIDGTWMTIYDVSVPAAPTEIGKCAVLGDGKEIEVDGDFAYVTEESSGISVINISDPSNPVLIDSYSKESISGVDVDNGYAYLCGADSELTVLKVSGFFDLTQSNLYPVTEEPQTLGLSGDYLLAGTYDGSILTDDILKIIDISDPAAPNDVCFFTPLGTVRGIKTSNDYIYITANEFGGVNALQVIDFSNPAAAWTPQVYSYEFSEDVGGLAVKGDYAYIANNSAGFSIVDVSDPADPDWPSFTSTIDTFGRISDCVIEGDNLYLLTSGIGLQIYDITDPVAPVFLGKYSTTGLASAIDVKNNWIFIADCSEGLKIIDVSSPSVSGWTPHVYSYRIDGDGVYTTDVKVEGEYAYITYYDGVPPYDDVEPGVAVIGVSNPATPYLAGQMDIQGEGENNIVVDGEWIYIASDAAGLEVIEVIYEE